MIAASIFIAVISTIGGLVISYYADLPSGASIVALASFIFFVVFTIGRSSQ
jgi:ABC-type Mn2+/Zn2+ transport system permease subunit